MTQPVYYNEIDKYAAQWLRNLIDAGEIAYGYVDERSIEDVRPSDLSGFAQCHFFAGIGVWSYALRRAGWRDARPVWTASCPCQPFSTAGAGAGFDDQRHLWPALHWLIAECRPATVIGEQVASKDAEPWLDLVQTDMEGLGYPFGALAFPSAGVGAPHIRDRLYWVAHAGGARLEGGDLGALGGQRPAAQRGGAFGGLANTDSSAGGKRRPVFRGRAAGGDAQPWAGLGRSSNISGLADTDSLRWADLFGESSAGLDCGDDLERALVGLGLGNEAGGLGHAHGEHARRNAGAGDCPQAGPELRRGSDEPGASSAVGRPGPTNGLWAAADWLLCRDGRWRPVEPGAFPLVDGIARGLGRVRADQERLAAQLPRKDQGSRTGRLKGYGNAINAEAACVFIEAVMEAAA